MNFAGKFDATFPSEGPGTHSHAYTHVDSSQTHAPADAIIVPDAQLLFHADYSRSGADLILSRDHHEYVVHDYFHGEKRAPLASPDGAHLTADIVKALVGEVEVSQAGTAPAASQVIGHVTKLQGSATVIRNGVSIILNMGDNVEKGDVVESGANSTVGITFIDGTVFGLSSNARMVLNEMVYDPNGSSNSSLMSLVAGTITFVAGETAKHGDMKIDTPVATMGIRGTAVLVEIDFTVPGQGGQPNASFQVLVEPDGTTGSYILFDKNTLQPIAIVNQAGQQVNINNGIINITTNPLTPDLQKLITDVFQQKFTDNSTNTKSTSPSTDSIIPTSQPLVIKTADATIKAQTVIVQGGSTQAPPTTQNSSAFHVSGPPIIQISNLLGVGTTSFQASGEQAGLTGSPLPDGAVGIVNFNDINVGDHPTVSAAFGSFTYKNAHGQDVTASLSALQLADIAATEANLKIIPGANNTNVGSAFFIYSVADQSFDFLAAGEQLTLTYYITVNENYTPDPTARITVPITITITGTNDVPVITTSAQSITFVASGTKTVGGDLQTANPTSGTLNFTDVDLTDTHTVSTALTKVVMSNGGTLPPLPESVFENALTASIGVDSTGTGNGTINWQLAPLQAYLADFIPLGVTVTLTYTVTVTDSQGATATQTITVVVPGDESPAVVWIHTTTDGHDNLWSDKLNWETGTVPIATDDVIISTNQLHPDTPAYPVTIDAKTAAVANSVTMNDFVNLPPELDVLKGGSLTIGAALSMSADSILHNAGTVGVGGKIELLDSVDAKGNFLALNHGVIVNSGTLNLKQGGDFQGLASITNTGTIDLKGGVLNVLVEITNFGTNTANEDEKI
ncbi:MAG: FecR domain-containing protein, partial [Bradyrhizobium sp.]|nr:FecR domain-containing protein [Bradyrhizobium sp.]